MSGPKILTLDIETVPIKAYVWALWKQNIGLNQIDEEWTIVSFSAKWLGDPKVDFQHTGGRGVELVRDDAGLLAGLWTYLDEADIVVAQNGVKFDLKKINARLIMNGFGPYSPVKVVDTMLASKKHFGFTSNRLAWLSEHLTDTPKDEHKEFPGFELWAEILKDNPRAWAEMDKYNRRDVEATEKLYLKLRPWIEGHPNVANHDHAHEHDGPVCPKCGSLDLRKQGFKYTQTGKYQQYQCNACMGWSRSRYTLNTLAERKNLLTN